MFKKNKKSCLETVNFYNFLLILFGNKSSHYIFEILKIFQFNAKFTYINGAS